MPQGLHIIAIEFVFGPTESVAKSSLGPERATEGQGWNTDLATREIGEGAEQRIEGVISGRSS